MIKNFFLNSALVRQSSIGSGIEITGLFSDAALKAYYRYLIFLIILMIRGLGI